MDSKYLIIPALAILAVSCDKYLDVLPDSRMELQTKEDVSKLLVSAYPSQSSAYLLETYSDNTDEIISPSWTEYDKYQVEAWEWADITSIDDETPQELWNAHYRAIASANVAIDYIKSHENLGMSLQLGEALACRAFNAFKLYEIFCLAYDPATAAQSLGIPYPTEPETVVGQEYKRGTIAELFQKIDEDIQAAMNLVGNEYSAPKYHFTKDALCAFACRFYLNYRKFDLAIKYATEVLGPDPVTKLRDWATWRKISPNGQDQPNAFVRSDEPANILLLPVYSQFGVYVGPYLTACKYRHSLLTSQKETLDSNGPWGNCNNTLGFYKWYNTALPGPFIRTILYAFEYTDLQAGIGYAHSVRTEFTMDEVLMERAEAYALSGNYDAAVADINTELLRYRIDGKVKNFTVDEIASYYGKLEFYTDDAPTVRKKFNTSMVTDEQVQEPVLQCILHLQRLINLHQGKRLQVVKRYGIEMLRRSLDASSKILEIKDRMSFDDPRQAIQLPIDVITGNEKMKPLEPNPR